MLEVQLISKTLLKVLKRVILKLDLKRHKLLILGIHVSTNYKISYKIEIKEQEQFVTWSESWTNSSVCYKGVRVNWLYGRKYSRATP